VIVEIVPEMDAEIANPFTTQDNAGTIYSWVGGFGGDKNIRDPDFGNAAREPKRKLTRNRRRAARELGRSRRSKDESASSRAAMIARGISTGVRRPRTRCC
jgi:hypothetical protein